MPIKISVPKLAGWYPASITLWPATPEKKLFSWKINIKIENQIIQKSIFSIFGNRFFEIRNKKNGHIPNKIEWII